MNTLSLKNIISIILIQIIFSQIVFMHNIVQDLVICYGDDGHIQIENINDQFSCDNGLIFSTEGEVKPYFNNVDCRDKSIDEYCLEEEPFVSNNNITFNYDIQKYSRFIFQLKNNKEIFSKNDTKYLKNHILERYNTVSLIV